jgi:hypothetical protein
MTFRPSTVKGHMFGVMRGGREYRKVLRSVVQRVVVDVMDMLRALKRATKNRFHNVAMLKTPTTPSGSDFNQTIDKSPACVLQSGRAYWPAIFQSEGHGTLSAPPVLTPMSGDESLVILDSSFFPKLDWCQIAASALTRVGFASSLAFSHSTNIPPNREASNATCLA